MGIKSRVLLWTGGLSVVLVASVLTSARLGTVSIDTWTVARAMANTLAYPSGVAVESQQAALGSYEMILPVPDIVYTRPLNLSVGETEQLIVQQIRLPRILLGAVVGFALATAGAVMQGFFQNPMADPSIIGVSSGAAVGAVAVIAFPIAVPFGLQTAAFVGALIAAFLVYLIASENGRTPVATLLLAGLAVQAFLGAIISYMLLQSGENLEEAILWLMGHLHDHSWARVEATVFVTAVMFVVLLAYARDLNVMLLGEKDAHALGIDVERTKRLLLAGSSIMTATAVAVTGVIGFVGLIVPHMMRLVVGPDHRILIPTSALAGSVFLVLADTFARTGPEPVPVGIVTAAIGAPFFIFLLRRQEVHAL